MSPNALRYPSQAPGDVVEAGGRHRRPESLADTRRSRVGYDGDAFDEPDTFDSPDTHGDSPDTYGDSRGTYGAAPRVSFGDTAPVRHARTGERRIGVPLARESRTGERRIAVPAARTARHHRTATGP